MNKISYDNDFKARTLLRLKHYTYPSNETRVVSTKYDIYYFHLRRGPLLFF